MNQDTQNQAVGNCSENLKQHFQMFETHFNDPDFLLKCFQRLPIEEEIDIFDSYKNQLEKSFQLFSKATLAISLQEEELFNAKKLLIEKCGNFNRQIAVIKEEIVRERAILTDLKKECANYHRKIRHLEKQYQKLEEKCPPQRGDNCCF